MDDLKLYGQNKKLIEKLVNLVRIFRKDIRMGLSINKCVTRGIISRSEGIQLLNEVKKIVCSLHQEKKITKNVITT